MPFEGDNQQQSQSDSPAQVSDNQSESNLQATPQESSDFNSQQRDGIKESTSQMVENGTLPELSLHNTANNGSIGVEGSNNSSNSQSSELKDGMQDKSAVRRGEGPYDVAERLLGGEDANNSDVKALTGALKDQYRDETNNKDFMMNNLKQGRELLTDKNVDQVLSKISDPEQRQRISEQLTQESGKENADSSTPETKDTSMEKPQDDKSGESNPKGEQSKDGKSRGLIKEGPKQESSKEEPKPESNDYSKEAPKPDSQSEPKSELKNEVNEAPKPDSIDSSKEAPKEETKPGEESKPDAEKDSPELKEGAVDRSQFDEELSDPAVMVAFAGRMKSEVGSQGEDAQLAFAEEVMNRAASRDQTIMEALKGSYYPTHNPGKSNNPDYHEAITKAWKDGTDTIEGATGNASGTVGFGAGKARRNSEGDLVAPNQTVEINGERFGYEQVDLDGGWMDEYKKLKKGG